MTSPLPVSPTQDSGLEEPKEDKNIGLTRTLQENEEDSNSSNDEDVPDYSWSSIKRYSRTRFTTLGELHLDSLSDLNPLPALKEMTPRNWNFFFMGFIAWFSASFAFFLTAVSGTVIAESLEVSTKDITWGLSSVLMVRSAGAVIFGLWTDNYSRKWPFIATAAMFCVLQIGTGFCNTYTQFLAGGTYATAAATSLEDAPLKARSTLSGLFFTAYPFGMVFAAIFWRAFQETDHTWKALFWFSAGIPFVLIIWRLLYPETIYFTELLKVKKLIKEEASTSPKISKWAKTKTMFSKYWLLFTYLVLLLASSNFLTHASQDMYPTMLRSQFGWSNDAQTVAIVVTNLGGVIGSLVTGIVMEVLGRRLSILLCCVIGGSFIYPALMLHTTSATLGCGFFMMFGVLGVWGVIPAHLSELSPPDARVLVSGLAYQLGNLASSASSTIETDLAQRWPLEWDAEGNVIRLDYAKTIAVFTGAVFIYTVVIALVGPEKYHRDLNSPLLKKYFAKLRENDVEKGSSSE
ncbi:Carboxylic acid transporter protein homolog [Cyberlindnera jadinii]|uniref:Carboxylic acid transporter protein homolog n=1 Tax=Cyberlindnera jadinii (strain ATCC 18201 / CBS 1600 / BCRC 20928 / JCM 3617 / NBRC 0987 / NRRL Y-1542) TaxID=983966 RepID=A0A0H5C2G2_CYBJN|nr:Carboxylic acid transporter protein homolog [Cyberlindnera jadinii]